MKLQARAMGHPLSKFFHSKFFLTKTAPSLLVRVSTRSLDP